LWMALDAMSKTLGVARASDSAAGGNEKEPVVGSGASLQRDGSESFIEPQQAAASATPEIDAGRADNRFDDTVGGGQAQAIQNSGDRLRAALEDNTRMTVSLFNRTLELMDRQNRELGEVERKLAELGGQIKSLKNL